MRGMVPMAFGISKRELRISQKNGLSGIWNAGNNDKHLWGNV